jgi:hypothetical protein
MHIHMYFAVWGVLRKRVNRRFTNCDCVPQRTFLSLGFEVLTEATASGDSSVGIATTVRAG